MALDHGILNVPLEKRGNFHKELDDYLAAEKRRKEDELFLRKSRFEADQKEAKKLYLLIERETIKSHAKRLGLKFSELRDDLKGMCNSHPKKAIACFEGLIEEQSNPPSPGE